MMNIYHRAKFLAAFATVATTITFSGAVLGQSFNTGSTSTWTEPVTCPVTPPVTRIQEPTIFTPNVTPYIPPVPMTADVTFPVLPPEITQINPGSPLSGVVESKFFPASVDLKGSLNFLLVRTTPDTQWSRTSEYCANVVTGQLLIAVRKPSQIGMITCQLGKIAACANADALITFQDGILHVYNLDGLGNTVRISLDAGPFAGASDPVYNISPGYELVAGVNRLSHQDLRPHDGIARRRTRILGTGNVAVSEFSVESVLHSNSLVASMSQQETDKDKRIIADMSKMAAVLNQVNGTSGFTGNR
jgi:hypothetical protein